MKVCYLNKKEQKLYDQIIDSLNYLNDDDAVVLIDQFDTLIASLMFRFFDKGVKFALKKGRLTKKKLIFFIIKCCTFYFFSSIFRTH